MIKWSVVQSPGTAFPGFSIPVIKEMTYDPDRKLSDVILPEGWTWVHGDRCPAVDNNGYPAIFAPSDGGYKEVLEILTVPVKQKLLAKPSAAQTSYNYNGSVIALNIIGFDERTMTVTGNKEKDVGDHEAKITLIDNVNYGWADGKDVIIKWSVVQSQGTASPGFSIPVIKEMTYDPDRKLSDVILPEGWTWVQEDRCPFVGNTGYMALFVPADEGYDAVLEILTVPVKQKLLPKPVAPQTSYNYNGSMITLVMDNVDTKIMKVTGNVEKAIGDHTATVTIVDENYAWIDGSGSVTILWSISVSSGTSAPGFSIPVIKEMTYDPDRKLSDVILPEGWTWVQEDRCPFVGNTGYMALFVPADEGYDAVLEILTVPVKQKLLAKPFAPQTTYKYSGSVIALDLTGFNASLMSVTGNTGKDVDDYEAKVTLSDGVNYGWIGGKDVIITWSIVTSSGISAPDFFIPKIGEMTYDPDRKLSDVTLPEGWAWVHGDRCPTVSNGGYLAIFIPTDDGYEAVLEILTVSVKKKLLTEPAAPQTSYNYNGSIITLDMIGFDEGTMTVTGNKEKDVGDHEAKITLLDNVNYGWAGEKDVIIKWSVTRSSGTESPGFGIPVIEGMTYDPDRKLSDVILPEGWAWVNGMITPTVSNGGYLAIFIPSDGGYDATLEMLAVPVERKLLDTPTAPQTLFKYNGSDITVAIENIDLMIMRITGNVGSAVGSYAAVIVITDENYGWNGLRGDTVTILWSITTSSDIPGLVMPEVDPMVYDPDRKLSDIILPEGWEWTDGGLTPAVNNNGYIAVFTPADGGYETITATVMLSVTQKLLTGPTAPQTPYNYNGSEITLDLAGFDERTMTVTGNKEMGVGDHEAKITLIDNVNYAWTDGNDVTVVWSIITSPGTSAPDFFIPEIGEMTYDPERKLSDVILPEGWAWVHGKKCPTADNGGHLAIFVPEDEGYDAVLEILIVPIKQKLLAKPVAPQTSYNYNGSMIALGMIGFDGMTMTVTGNTGKQVREYEASITLSDGINYGWTDGHDVTIVWSIITSPGTSAPDFSIPEIGEMTYDPDRKLSDVILPEGWTWVHGDNCPFAGSNGHSAIFIPADDGYDAVLDVLTVPVKKKLLPKPVAPQTSYNYDGSVITLNLTGFNASLMSVTGNTGKHVREYEASITLSDGINYGWIDGNDVTIIWSVVTSPGTYAPDFVLPGTGTVAFDPEGKLSDVTLPEGWAWVNGTITPTVNNSGYEAMFTPADNGYDTVKGCLALIVTPKLVDAPVAGTTSFSHTGSEIVLQITGSDGMMMEISGDRGTSAGEYLAVIKITDGNYAWTDGSDSVTIEWSIVITYTLTPGVYGNGKILWSAGGEQTELTGPTEIPDGTTVVLTAVADDRHVFVKWYGDVSDTESVITVTITSDMTVSAKFAEEAQMSEETWAFLFFALVVLISIAIVVRMVLNGDKEGDR